MRRVNEAMSEMNTALYKLENNLLKRLEDINLRKNDETNLNSEVKQLKGRVEHFVQSLMKLLSLPGIVRNLEDRITALE